MERYDVVSVGGGIAGSIAARLADGVKMMAANAANRFLPPEKVFTLPF